MSGGLSWDEAYASLFSVTTHGYYGNDLYDLVTTLDVIEEPGKQFSYRSGDTQILAFVVEKATGKSISDYAEEKLGKPMQACQDGCWIKRTGTRNLSVVSTPRRGKLPVLPV